MTRPAARTQQSRRRFLQQSAVATVAVMTNAVLHTKVAWGADYTDLKTDDYLGAVAILAKVEDTTVFTEGPAADRNGNLLFTNVPVNKILKWDPRTKLLSVFRENSNETNGLYFAPDGSLLACEGATARVTRTDAKTGKIEVLAEGFQGRRLAKPNDLCMDDRGRVYFTSRSATEDPEGENVKAVYRIDPDGSLHQILAWPDVHMPNGIVTSPDNKKLYLIEAHPDADHHRDIRVYDLNADGSVANGRVLIDFYPGRSGDGMCIDAEGNLYVAAGLHKTRKTSETLDTKPGIHVVSPQGKLIAYRETPEDTITNCTFGGEDLKTLYVACGSLLLSIRTKIPGKASYKPQG
ncbi:MAG: SMP-30/gluconolactonase/LRE family protein [Planctomycetota bacterium]|nr:SMP-30/gluconolactonase/LRE family protein [Planctomycetota bacterium]